MTIGRRKQPLILTEEERSALEYAAFRKCGPPRLALRAHIVLASADGLSNLDVARKLGITTQTVGKWRSRFLVDRLEGLSDEPRTGAPRSVSDRQIERILVRTLEGLAPGREPFTTRSLAEDTGLSQSSIIRIWHAFGFQPRGKAPHRLAPDPFDVDTLSDLVGLFFAPPRGALVLRLAQRSPEQAPVRPLPRLVLPLPNAADHDPSATSLTLPDTSKDSTPPSLTPNGLSNWQEKLVRFLQRLDGLLPARDDLGIHVVLDSYATFQTAQVRGWLRRRPRFTAHLTPTSSTWQDRIQGLFADVARPDRSPALIAQATEVKSAFDTYLRQMKPRISPFTWVGSAGSLQGSGTGSGR